MEDGVRVPVVRWEERVERRVEEEEKRRRPKWTRRWEAGEGSSWSWKEEEEGREEGPSLAALRSCRR